MKNTLMLIAFGFMAITASAQKLKEAEVPAAIKASFSKLHPNAKVDKWEKEEANYEAEFMDNNVETSVEFGPNGQLIATEIEIAVASLPKAVAEYVTKNVAGKKIKEASKITAASGTVSYEAEVGEADYIFDANGTFVKKEVEKDDKDDDDDDKK